MLLTPNTLLQNRYTIMRLIAQGGMGAVYEAMDHRLKCTVAVKQILISEEIGPKRGMALRNAFEREAHLLARLRHPALTVVSDHFSEGGEQFLVMQFIPGDDLATMLETNSSFPISKVLHWADWLLDALDYLHSQQPPIVHRDIKPKNLKLTPRGEIIMLDLGLAKSAVKPKTTTSSGIGVRGYTTDYAPLEQIQGTAADPRSDLYALAATLYHLLTGETPPDALTRAAAALSGQPDPLRPANELNPQLTPSLAVILQQAMAHKMAQRFVSANALRHALRTVQQSLPALDSGAPAINSGGITTVPVSASPSAPALAPPSVAVNVPQEVAVPLTLVVSKQGQGHYKTITEAVENALPGSRILVRPGLYNEGFVIDKPLEISGDGPAADIIVESTNSSCIVMRTEHAVVRGLLLRGWAGLHGNRYVAVDIPQGRLVLERCTITSDSLACIAIHGFTANPVIWRCRMFDGKSVGILVYDHGQGLIEECDIAGHAESGIEIKQVGNPVIRRCKIYRSEQDGIAISDRGAGTIEGCNIFENTHAGIVIQRGSNPFIRLCKIHHQLRGCGVSVYDKGEGTIEGCDIFNNETAGVEISQGGNPVIRRCKLHGGKQQGIVASDRAEGIIEECSIVDNAAAGIEIGHESNLVIRRTTLNRNGTVGIVIHDRGKASVEGSNLMDNQHGAWSIESDGQVRSYENTE